MTISYLSYFTIIIINSRSQGPFVAVDKLVKIIAEKCPQSFEQMLERMAGMKAFLEARATDPVFVNSLVFVFCRHLLTMTHKFLNEILM